MFANIETHNEILRVTDRNSASRSVVSNASCADERRCCRCCRRRCRSGCQEPGRRRSHRRGVRVREPAAANAEPANRLRRDLPDLPDTDVLCVDNAPHAADTLTLPKRQPGRAGHQCVSIGVLHDLPPKSEPEHVLTLRDYSQPQCVTGKIHRTIEADEIGGKSSP